MINYLLSGVCGLMDKIFFGKTPFVPVLLYHIIDDSDRSKISISVSEFAKQMTYLKQAGYNTISPTELSGLAKLPEGTKPILITFDDGHRSILTRALPLLEKDGFAATVFLLGERLEHPVADLLSPTEALALKNKNWTIASHFFSHNNLDLMTGEEIDQEYLSAKKQVELVGGQEAGKIVSYPHNRHNQKVVDRLTSLGASLAFAGQPGLYFGQNNFAIPRLEVKRGFDLARFKLLLSPTANWLRTKKKSLAGRWSRLGIFKWLVALLLLLLIRALMVWGAWHNWPFINSQLGFSGCCFGGDEINYFDAAQALFKWQFISSSYPIGFSLFLMPLLVIFQAKTVGQVVWPLILLQSLLFYSLATMLVYALANKFFRSRFKSLLLASLFLIYPYFFYYFFWFFSHGQPMRQFIISRFSQLFFLTALSDPLALLLVLSSLLLFLSINADNRRSAGWLGLVTSLAVIIRFQNAILLPIYFLLFLFFRQFKNAFGFFIYSLPLLFFQLYANYRSFGSATSTVYQEIGYQHGSVFSFSYIFKIFEYAANYSPLLFLPLAVLAVILALGFYSSLKKNRKNGIVLLSYFLGIFLFIGFLAPTFLNPRYFLPLIPVMLIAGWLGLEQIVGFLAKSKNI